jgi:hypothetical protein
VNRERAARKLADAVRSFREMRGSADEMFAALDEYDRAVSMPPIDVTIEKPEPDVIFVPVPYEGPMRYR